MVRLSPRGGSEPDPVVGLLFLTQSTLHQPTVIRWMKRKSNHVEVIVMELAWAHSYNRFSVRSN